MNKFIFKSTVLIMLIASACNKKELICVNSDNSPLQMQSTPTIYILKDLKKSYFLNNLWRLTYYNGKYYNINKEKGHFYSMKFQEVNKDTVYVELDKEFHLSIAPVDFSIFNDTVYFLNANETGALCKMPLYSKDVSNRIVEIDSELVIALDSVSVPINTRIKVLDSTRLVAKVGDAISEPENQNYFSIYNLNDKKLVSEFAVFFPQTPDNYYPAMDYPFRLDLDSISIVSFGNKGNFFVYNNSTGLLKGEYCAYSEKCASIVGMDIRQHADIQLSMNYMIEKAYYLGFINEPSSKLFLRIVKHDQKLRKNNSRKINKREDAAWSMIVLDSVFNKVGEIVLPAGELNFTKYFTDNNGVHFLSMDDSSSNINSPILKFNKISIK